MYKGYILHHYTILFKVTKDYKLLTSCYNVNATLQR